MNMNMASLKNVAALASAILGVALTAQAQLSDVSFVRQRLFGGFDGTYCKIQPSITTDGRGTTFLTYQNLLLTGCDVFYGQCIVRSSDEGKTWGTPQELTALKDTYERGYRVARYANPLYLAKAKHWLALGTADLFKDDDKPYQVYEDGHPYAWPLMVDMDPVRGTYTGYRKLEFPFQYEFAMPFGQTVECEDGDVLIPFYFRPIGGGHRGRCVVVRYRFDGKDLRIVRAGKPIYRDDLARGLGEPSIVHFKGKYYMTLRSDEAGHWCESDDGLDYTAPRLWTWLDGQAIGNRNTQQHWVKVGGRLYLAYTRETPTNGHVFRNRAPIFLAAFDPTRGGLVRETERPVVPERGARLGNFWCREDAHGGFWLLTAEWMQPKGCDRYGSDNSLWLVRLSERPKNSRGALLLTFDDGHFDNWDKALPLFDRFGAHATFFVNGKLDEKRLMRMRTYQSYGHSIGLHGSQHIRATPFVKEHGLEAYLKTEIEPQLAAIRKAKLEIRNFGYPMSDRNEAIDAALKSHFSRLRTGHVFGRDPAKQPLATCDEAFASRASLATATVIAGMGFGSKFPGIAEDIERGLERVAARDEALVLYTHNIKARSDGDSHNTSLDVLERILVKAHALGIEVIGFDEL